MPEGRPAIPRPLERDLFIEAGFRCAIPTCRAAAPLVIEHIEDWADVREHKFENMIVICANCHGRKGGKRGDIDRRALRRYKANLALLSYRYGEFERRVLDLFAQSADPGLIVLPGGMDLLLHYLVRDGYINRINDFNPPAIELKYQKDNDADVSTTSMPLVAAYELTEAGKEFVQRWKEAKPLDV